MKKILILLLTSLISLTLVTLTHLKTPAEASVSALMNEENTVAEIHSEQEQGLIAQYPYNRIPEIEPIVDPRREAISGLSGIEIASLLSQKYPGWKDRLPSCPCRVSDIDDSTFVRSSWIARRYQFNIEDFHPGAIYDYRQTAATLRDYNSPVDPNAVPIRPGQQCTYDENGYLLNHGIGAGTPDTFGPEDTGIGSFVHTDWDVNPFKEIVGDSASEATSNIRGLNMYHRTWTPDLGKNSRGETCPLNPRPIEQGTYNVGSRYITVVYSDDPNRNRVCYTGISSPPGRYAVAVGETTGSLSYSLEYDEGYFIIDGWKQYDRTVILGQGDNSLLVTHKDTAWTGEYELFMNSSSSSGVRGPLARCLQSDGIFFETAPGYQININR